jgi:hypothetical protein
LLLSGDEDFTEPNWTSSSWSIQTVDSSGTVGSWTSLALDFNGNPHISYCDNANNDLKYAYWTGSAWHIETVDSAGMVGAAISLALDQLGNAQISYFDSTNSALKYANWTGLTWNIQTVATGIGLITYTSLALDSYGNPHISYYNQSNGALYYASWNYSSWITDIVDSRGSESSLALDTADKPHISYSSSYSLKYAFEVWDTSIAFSLSPNPALVGQTVLLQGNLSDRLGQPLNNTKVNIYLNGAYTASLFTNSSGWFKASAPVNSPGTFTVNVTYPGSDTYNPSSHTETLTVSSTLDTKVTFTLSPNPATVGQTITLKGNLTGIGNNLIGNAPLELWVKIGASAWQYMTTLSTNATGWFQASGSVTSMGIYQVAVVYRGTSQYNLSYKIETLTVNP